MLFDNLVVMAGRLSRDDPREAVARRNRFVWRIGAGTGSSPAPGSSWKDGRIGPLLERVFFRRGGEVRRGGCVGLPGGVDFPNVLNGNGLSKMEA